MQRTHTIHRLCFFYLFRKHFCKTNNKLLEYEIGVIVIFAINLSSKDQITIYFRVKLRQILTSVT